MSRHDSAPTHGWVISSRINRWLALILLLLVFFMLLAVYAIRYTLERDCRNVYKRDFLVSTYWIHVEAGSTKLGCPQYGQH